ncbi:MAG TPA: hypothetical protein VMV83_03620 [Rectinemataceae bacterium]|nr:hypothetical protein [Rectinemataceae bacterium]
MANDFLFSSKRHLRCAEVLDKNTEHADAAHLYGLAAECAVKSVLLGASIILPTSDNDIPRGNRYRSHINLIVRILGSIQSGRTHQALFAMLQPDIQSFSTWNVDDRYKNETAIAMGDYARWKQAAAKANAMLILAASQGCAL